MHNNQKRQIQSSYGFTTFHRPEDSLACKEQSQRNAWSMSLLIFRSCSPRIFTHELNLALTSWYRGLADHARSQEPLSHAIPKNRIKRPGRGGRNLRDRYLALEKSLRGKEALSKSRDDQHQTTATNTSAIPGLKSPGAPMFRGFVVPIEPSPPKSDGETYPLD